MAKPALQPDPRSRPLPATAGSPYFARSRLPGSGIPLPSALPESEANDNDVVDTKRAPFALLILRLAVGAMFLEHVMRVVFGYEPTDPSQLFGLPTGVSPYGLVWDALIGLALLYGVWARLAAIGGAATLSVAAITAHGATGTSPFAWQPSAFWIVALLAFALAGDGAFALVSSRSGFRTEQRK